MSKIILLTADPTNSASSNTKALLESLGHFVDAVDTVVFLASDLTLYDLITVVRWGGVADMVQAALKIRSSGKPALVGMSSGAAPGGQSGYGAFEIGLASYESVINANDTDQISQLAAHSLWTAFGETSVRPTAGTLWIGSLPDSDFTGGTAAPGGLKIGSVASSAVGADRRGCLWTFEAGTNFAPHIGGPLLARMVYLGQVYAGAGSTYTPEFAPFVQCAIDWLLAEGDGPVVEGVISGNITDEQGNPLERVVRAYLRGSGAMDGESVSGPSGAFTINVKHAGELHYVIALDEEAGEKNALIADRVAPVIL